MTSFANRGLPGQVDLPIFTATGIAFTNTNAINNLLNGAAGTLANTLATNRDFSCSMFGSAHPRRAAPAPARARVIPSTSGGRTNSPPAAATLMDDTGFSNYHGLQVEFRQRKWHGMSLNANYTLSKTMGVATRGETLRPAIPSSQTATSYPATRLPSPTGGMSST